MEGVRECIGRRKGDRYTLIKEMMAEKVGLVSV